MRAGRKPEPALEVTMAARSRKAGKAAPKSPKATKSTKARNGANGAQAVIGDAVQQIWLAGMGALARVQKEGPKAFESMIVEGASLLDKSRGQAEATLRDAIATVQAAVEGRVKETKVQATETWDSLEQVFQSRVQQVLKQVGVPTAKDVAALTRRVDQLNASVQSLAKTKRTAPKKATRRSSKAAPAAAPAA
jgi:poly(hydroxyalkanoate) granule-associated protein